MTSSSQRRAPSSRFFEKPKSFARVKSCSAPSSVRACSSFLGADHAQQVGLLGADDVLATGSAGQRQVSGARVFASRMVGHERRVLVIGVRADVQDTGRRLQPLELSDNGAGTTVVDRPNLRTHLAGV